MDKSTSKDVIRRVRKAVGDADMSASGAVRVAGVENWKPKYLPEPPIVSIIHAVPGRLLTLDHLHQMRLVAEREPAKSLPFRVSPRHGGSWPEYARCVAGAPPNHTKDGPDISRADFTWALMALRRGNSIEETAVRLGEFSGGAKENGDNYAFRTAQNAAAVVEREWQRSRA